MKLCLLLLSLALPLHCAPIFDSQILSQLLDSNRPVKRDPLDEALDALYAELLRERLEEYASQDYGYGNDLFNRDSRQAVLYPKMSLMDNMDDDFIDGLAYFNRNRRGSILFPKMSLMDTVDDDILESMFARTRRDSILFPKMRVMGDMSDICGCNLDCNFVDQEQCAVCCLTSELLFNNK